VPPFARRSTARLKPIPLRRVSYRISTGTLTSAAGGHAPAQVLPPLSQPHRPIAGSKRLKAFRYLAGPAAATDGCVTEASLTATLPVPPSINRQYATVNGRRVLSSEGRSYKALVAQQIMVLLARSPHRQQFHRRCRERHLALSIRFYFPSLLRRDVDGGLKIAQDSLCNALAINDNRITEIHLQKHVDAAHPRMEISLHPTDPQHQIG
jgi:crossover junction endodeoxyribonuclease RusA